MKHLKAEDHRRMMWKNNKGQTTEIAIFPDGASLDDFDWRISMASVTEDGAFSQFPQIDRVLCVLSGNGIALSVANMDESVLTPSSPPFHFPGDAPSSARLIDGLITDLNIMTRRGKSRASVERGQIDQQGWLLPISASATSVLLCLEGQITLPDHALSLGPFDAIQLSSNAVPLRLLGSGSYARITLHPAQGFFYAPNIPGSGAAPRLAPCLTRNRNGPPLTGRASHHDIRLPGSPGDHLAIKR